MNRHSLLAVFLSFLLLPLVAADTSSPNTPAQTQSADALWSQISSLKGDFMQAMRAGDGSAKSIVPQLQDALKTFASRYPHDPRIWEAKMALAQMDLIAEHMKLPGAPVAKDTVRQLEAIAVDKEAPKEVRAQASFIAITESFPSGPDAPFDYATLDGKIKAFEKAFGDFSFDGSQPAIFMLREQELEVLKMAGGKADYNALLKTLSGDSHPELVAMAQRQIAQDKRIAELETKPFDLKFTAVDGTKVDVSQMRGKVVLIDFWATWCGPCVAEMPEVVDAYQKLHGQGFEIIGISLDQDKSALLSFIKQNGIAWPQYFDGKGFDNVVSKALGIDMIPTMWLIDRKGMLVNTEVRGNLVGSVKKLLAK